MARDDLATWEAALHEANRALELAARGVDRAVAEHAAEVRDELAAEVKDQRVLAKLERLQQERGVYSEELFLLFRDALSSFGLDLEGTAVDDAARTIRESSIGSAIVLALDQWLLLVRGPLRERLYEIAQRADTDTWRRRVRVAVVDDDERELSRLAAEASARAPDPSTFDLLASALYPRWHREPPASGRGPEQAEDLLRAAQRVHPGDYWLNIRLGAFLWQIGKLEDAIQYLRIAVALRPESAHGRYKLGAALGEHEQTAEAIDELTRSIVLDPELPFAYRTLSDLLREDGEELPRAVVADVPRILHRIRSAGRPFDEEGLVQLLARAQASNGDVKRAILTLEESVRQRGAPRASGKGFFGQASPGDDLVEFRRRLLPDLVSFASIDAAFDGSLSGKDSDVQQDALARFRALHDPADRSALSRLAYLEGRVLQTAKRSEEAIARFRRALEADAAFPEPFLRLAECLVASGEHREAETVLREALAEEPIRCPAAWNLWLEIGFVDLGRSAREAFRSLPVSADAAMRGVEGYEEDVRWLLERLSSSAPLLINCGGGAYAGQGDLAWERDRFYSPGSHSFPGRAQVGNVAATEDELLYQTNRWFPRGAGGWNGYRIPLPRGDYEVELHFAEVWHGALEGDRPRRSFDILVEGVMARESFEPMRNGFATAERVAVEARVEDGALDIEFLHRSDNPIVSAIAVRAKD